MGIHCGSMMEEFFAMVLDVQYTIYPMEMKTLS